MVRDVSIVADGPTYVGFVWLSAIGALVYTVGILACTFRAINREKNSNSDSKVLQFLYRDYSDFARHWELIEAVYKVALTVGVAMMRPGSTQQFMFAILLIAIYCIIYYVVMLCYFFFFFFFFFICLFVYF